MTHSSNIILLIPIYHVLRPVGNLRLPNEQKQAKTANSGKKMTEKRVEGIKK